VPVQVNANKKGKQYRIHDRAGFDTTDLELEQWKPLNSLNCSTFHISNRRLFYHISIGFFSSFNNTGFLYCMFLKRPTKYNSAFVTFFPLAQWTLVIQDLLISEPLRLNSNTHALDRIPLEEGSVRSRGLYLRTPNTHQTFKHLSGFETTIPATGLRPTT
jgi:hypothetical protein